ncbi:dolichyl-phosphate-mannose--protein mannosyltransferase [Georgenia subflava]|uniref:dolichyl-phosphate-mannose--protein mannosyltransferase n=1 Tax=Georgenia subflava TaxID=1622177 RepID=UPI001D035633|nr:phospholipid carrier-dependent glycosyltransferase [Georgenia subflava]
MTTPDRTPQLDGAGPTDREWSGDGSARTVLRRSLRDRLDSSAATTDDDAAHAEPDAGPSDAAHAGPNDDVHARPGDVAHDQLSDVARADVTHGAPGAGLRAPRTAVEIEDDLRTRLGLRGLGERLDPTARLWGWLGPLVVTALAAVLRLVNLNHPSRLIFDETYYVKQAYSMLTLGYEGDWPAEDANDRFIQGDFSDLSTEADYVVHPSVGKWMIALGLRLFGADNGAGWRFSAAVVGTLSVLIVARLATRMFGSALLGTVAGLLLAIDGLHLTESRTSLLDIFLMFWVLVGFWFVLQDRTATRAVLARRAAAELAGSQAGGPARLRDAWGPRVGPRWWLVGAGVALGLATGVKWSGLYAVAVFGIMVFVWDTCARRAVGARLWFGGGVLRGGVPAFLALVPTAALTYVATWFSWFTHPTAYRRQWAADLRESGEALPRSWLPDTLNSWWEYHLVMWDFHNGLDSEHSYEAHPLGWIVQWRPTSFFWPDPAPPPEACGADRCVQAITSLGNPALWWFAAAALVALVWVALRQRDWRAWAILAGYAAMYLPWFGYAHRTIFTFYAVAFVPYVVLCLTFVLGWATGLLRPARPETPSGPDRSAWPTAPGEPSERQSDGDVESARENDGDRERAMDGDREKNDDSRDGSGDGRDGDGRPRPAPPSRLALFLSDDGTARPGAAGWALLGVVVGLAAALAVFYWPVWTGQTVSYDFWRLHMWLPSWI